MAGEYIFGLEAQAYAVEQSAFGTVVYPAATDAFKHLKLTITPDEARRRRKDHRGTRSQGDAVRGKRSSKWSISAYLLPSGVLGTPPDIWPILKQGFGTETINAGASVVYTLLKFPELTHKGLSIHAYAGHLHVGIKDAIVQELSIKGSGSQEAEIEASGEGTEVIVTGTSTLGSSASNGASSVTVATGDGQKFSVDSKVDIGTSTGHTVTAIAGDVLTITPVLVGAQSLGVTVKPNQPGFTTAGAPVTETEGSFKIDTVAIDILSASFKLANKLKMRTNEYGRSVASGFSSPTFREVGFEADIMLRRDYLKYYGHAKNLVQKDIEIAFGSTAGKRARLDMDKTEFKIPAFEFPDGEDEMGSKISGEALPTSSGDDEVRLTFD